MANQHAKFTTLTCRWRDICSPCTICLY